MADMAGTDEPDRRTDGEVPRPDARPDGSLAPPTGASAVAPPPAPVLPGSGDAAGAPTLPPVLPAAPAPQAPGPPGSAAGTAPSFDAKAMVDAQRHTHHDPVYGAMPVGTDETRDAARRRREQANRRRRRRRVVSRIMALVLVGGLGVAGYYGYRTFRDRQDDGQAGDDDRSAADVLSDLEAEPDAGADASGSDPGALTPLGEQVEVIDALDTLNRVVQPSAGGYLGAIDDARSVVDDINGTSDTGAEAGADPAPAAAPAPTIIDAVVLRLDLGTLADPVVQNFVVDVADDTYFAATSDADGVGVAAETDAVYCYRYESGALTRARRSAAGLRPGPDALFAGPITSAVLLPPAAEPHAHPFAVGVTDAAGAPLLTDAFVVDKAAFEAADPELYRAWLTALGSPDPADRPAVEAGSQEPIEGVPADDLSTITAEAVDGLPGYDTGTLGGVPPVPSPGEVVVGWRIAGDGPYVVEAYVADGDGGFRWLYRVDDFDAPPWGPVLADAVG